MNPTTNTSSGLDALIGLGGLGLIVLALLAWVWLIVLGVLLPWYVWRAKVYTKRSYDQLVSMNRKLNRLP